MKILILGYGFVGKATHRLLTNIDESLDISIHDPALEYSVPKASQFDYVFICVPTDAKPGDMGELDISILKSVYNMFVGQQVIRSTIGPDHVEHFPGAIVFPEFLRENHWKEDVDDDSIPLIIGSEEISTNSLNQWFAEQTNKSVKVVDPEEAAMIKVARNAALAVKVEFANILYDTCQALKLDYNNIKDILVEDPNIGGSHWDVPGPDGKRGFGGKCLPKDTMHFNQLNSSAMISVLLMNNGRRR
tara:strand:- start:4406 stop:5143 length:738 start_codon:yes stop_codon:yes gene_type:complete